MQDQRSPDARGEGRLGAQVSCPSTFCLGVGGGGRGCVVIAQTIHLNRLPLKPLFFTLSLDLAAAGEEGDLPPER